MSKYEIYVNPDFLSEINLISPVTCKLVYLYISIFRNCTKKELAKYLGLDIKDVSRVLEELQGRNLIKENGSHRFVQVDKPEL
jgi:CRP-like cAMP-binding protein